jgi:hypothetical protein
LITVPYSPIRKRGPAGIVHRIGAGLLHEAREASIFFGFNFIVLTTNLLIAQYLVAVSNFMLATLAALVVGKAVLVANKMALVTRDPLRTLAVGGRGRP